MFSYANKQPGIIECNEGFSVQLAGREGLLYQEGERQLFVRSELLMSPSGLVMYTNSINAWEPPFHHDEIDAPKKEQIINNIVRAFRWTGYEIEVM
jgi:hypothetical protein